jgi:hypothetical protein
MPFRYRSDAFRIHKKINIVYNPGNTYIFDHYALVVFRDLAIKDYHSLSTELYTRLTILPENA